MRMFRNQLDSYEKRGDKVLAWEHFVERLIRHGIIAGLLIAFSLGMGMGGYILFERQRFIDAFLNAAMILGGMGPVAEIESSGGKIFAGLYALYSGLVFLVVTGLLLAPVVHRILHRFHGEISEGKDNQSRQ